MRKTALLLAIILILSMPLSAAAAPRSLEVEYTLDFSGTTAICEATVTGERPSDYVEVLLKLMHGPYCVGTWYDSSNYYVDLQGTTTVITFIGVSAKSALCKTIDSNALPSVA